MSDETPQEFTHDRIQRLLRNADRLGFGIRPSGFILINRGRLLEDHEISKKDADLIDQWVTDAGGALQPLRRTEPQPTPKFKERSKRPETIVWGIPARALQADAAPK
jgi:hypothetical protein